MNVILFSIDTLRADRLSCYGHNRLTSPHIDRLASQGALFTEYFSPHIPTFPGHTTMMTGRDVYSHQISGQSHAHELDPSIPMLAEILQRCGYYTAAADNLGRWFSRGIDHTESYSWDTGDPSAWRKGEAVNRAALSVINRAAGQDKPFFLFIHFWDPHTPYLPPAPFSRMFYEGDEKDPRNRSMDPVWSFENFKWYFNEWMPGVTDIEFPKAQYDAEIAYVDACLAHVFARLEELNLVDDTLIAFTTDHGEELDDHGCWFDHHGLYDPNTHIPLILRLPGKVPAGTRVPGFATHMDLMPTILDYAGLLDPSLQFDGASLRAQIDQPYGVSRGSRDVLHFTENTWMKKRAIRSHRWKLITALEPDMHGFPEVELYDLSADPGEHHNVAGDLPDVVRDLRGRIQEHVSARTAAEGLVDPLPVQPIPLKRIGKVEDKLATERARMQDEKIAHGDFVGYEREES